MIGDDLGGAQDFRVPIRIAIQRKPEHKFSESVQAQTAQS